MKRKKIVLSLVSVVLLLAMVVSVLVACNPNEQTATKYTVTFKNGETVVKTFEVDKDTALTAEQFPENPTPEAGYKFDGWFLESAKVEAGYKVQATVTFTAKFSLIEVEPETVTVTFKNGTAVVKTSDVVKGGKLTAEQIPADPTVEAGQKFDGWFVGTTKVDTNYVVNDSVDAVAKFSTVQTATQYTIEFKVDVDSDAVKTVTVDEGTALTAEQLPADPQAPSGKRFLGWYVGGLENGTKVVAGYVVNDNVTAFAEFEDVFAGFASDMLGEWKSEDGTITVVITANALTYNGSNGTDLSTSYGNYYFTVGETDYVIYMDVMSNSGHLFVGDKKTDVRVELSKDGWDIGGGDKQPIDVEIPDAYVGTWVGGDFTVVVTASGITVNGTNAVFYEAIVTTGFGTKAWEFVVGNTTYYLDVTVGGVKAVTAIYQDKDAEDSDKTALVKYFHIDSKYYGEFFIVGDLYGGKIKIADNSIIYFDGDSDYVGTDLAVREAGGYTFTYEYMGKDFESAVYFKADGKLYFYDAGKESELSANPTTPPASVAIPDALQNTTWTSEDGELQLVFSTNTVKVDLGDGLVNAILTAVNNWGDLTLHIEGKSYIFEYYDEYFSVMLDESVRLYKENNLAFPEELQNTEWVSEDGNIRLVFGTDTVQFDVGEGLNDGTIAEYDKDDDFLSIELDGLFYQCWIYDDHLEVKVDGEWIELYKELAFPAEFQNTTWATEDGSVQLVFGTDTIQFDHGNGLEDAVMTSYDEDKFTIEVDGVSYTFWLGSYLEGTVDDIDVELYKQQTPISVSFPESFRGTWKNTAGTCVIVIGETSLTLNGDNVVFTEIEGFGDYDKWHFTINDIEWTISLTESDDGIQMTAYDTEDSWFNKITKQVEFDSTLIGTWTSEDGNNTVIITSDSLTYNGKTATNVSVDSLASLGYYLTVDGVEYNVYYQGYNKKLVVKNVETEATVLFTKPAEPISVTFPEAFRGTWKDADETCELVIDENTLTVNGIVAVLYEVQGFGYYDDWTFTVNGNEWGIRVYIYSNVVTLSVSDNNNNYYDCTQAPAGAVVIDDEYVGEYDIEGSNDNLVITANGITYVDNLYHDRYVVTNIKVRSGGGYEFSVPDYYAYDAAVYFKSGKLYFYKDSSGLEFELTPHVDVPVEPVEIPDEMVGEWTFDTGYSTLSITITKAGITFRNGFAAVEDIKYENDKYIFKIVITEYNTEEYEISKSEGKYYIYYSYSNRELTKVTTTPVEPVELPSALVGKTWTASSLTANDVVMVVTAEGITIGGTQILVADMTYSEENEYSYSFTYDNKNCKIYDSYGYGSWKLMIGSDDFTLSEYVAPAPVVVSFPDEFVGTWNNADESVVVVITANSMTVNDVEAVFTESPAFTVGAEWLFTLNDADHSIMVGDAKLYYDGEFAAPLAKVSLFSAERQGVYIFYHEYWEEQMEIIVNANSITLDGTTYSGATLVQDNFGVWYLGGYGGEDYRFSWTSIYDSEEGESYTVTKVE